MKKYLMILFMFLFISCQDLKTNTDWKIPNVGEKYIHCKNEILVEANKEYKKFRVQLERNWINDAEWRNKSAFITVKNDTVVSVWVGPRGW